MTMNNGLALLPPMGWNSWDCFGTTVKEEEVRANATYMAQYLSNFGWKYIVVDIQWYEPNAKAGGYRSNAELITDEYGRLMPAENRFPTAANGVGFKALADYIHALGLKFGIHIMRGIPRQAVRQNLPILNTNLRAQDIADTHSICSWNDDIYGIDHSKEGAQAYYDSIIALYSSWDVDYIKADNMLDPYHHEEIAALAKAIQKSDRDILLSLSPGVDLSTEHYPHLRENCDLFRISGDFWDRWVDLKDQFEICQRWMPYTGVGCWADADMLPLGRIGIRAERGLDRQSRFTQDEQYTLMNLWSMCRSPMMFGGDLPSNDEFTLNLLTNRDVLKIQQSSHDNKELFRRDDQVVWYAKDNKSDDQYLALFNIGDESDLLIDVDLLLIGDANTYQFTNLWDSSDRGVVQGTLAQSIAPHASKIYRLQAQV